MDSSKQRTSGANSLINHIRLEHMAAGVTGGVVSSIALHPLDLLKVRFQGFGLAPCLVPSSSVPTLTYRPSARPAVSEVSRMQSSLSSPARIICFSCIHIINSSYFIILLIIINLSGKIVRIIIITTTITIIITNGNLSINISSHTNRQEKDKKLPLAV
ncbi:mitochondrial folate transporter/carrier [Elysia marginata]|uniref:Mitochondrial folate transporter/carrier n=1 Tax=Elysia marginata TaxID=1093978 RepID=A0AAV4HMW8_9GAST|nr:mitochondrial folate transporter/carrier [Elysia marginata]